MAANDTLTYVVTTDEGAEKSYINYTFSDGTVISRVSSRNPKGKMVSRWLADGQRITAETARKVIESAVEEAPATDPVEEDILSVLAEQHPLTAVIDAAPEYIEEEREAMEDPARKPVKDNPRPIVEDGVYYADIPFERADVAGIFWDQFGKHAAKELTADRYASVRADFDNSKKVITFSGTDEATVHAATEELVEMFDAAKETHKAWKKSSEEYKALQQGTKEGRQGAYRLTRDFWSSYVHQFLVSDLV